MTRLLMALKAPVYSVIIQGGGQSFSKLSGTDHSLHGTHHGIELSRKRSGKGCSGVKGW